MPTTGPHDQDAGNVLSPAGRRVYHRVDCDLEATFTIGGTGQTGIARCLNIGLGGLRVDFPTEVNIPAEVDLAIAVGNGESLEMRTRVVWTVTDRIDGPYPTGLQFGELPDQQRRRLYDVLGTLPPR